MGGPGEWIYQNLAFANVFATPEFGEFEPWRMLTAAFLHSQGFILHIVLNMYMLWIFGQALEPLLGRVRFLALYLISAIGGSVGYLLLTPGYVPGVPLAGVVGASGAIFGLFGAMLLVQRHRGGDTRQLWVLIAINGVIGFVVPQIAWQAHLGGLVTGALCAAVIAYTPRAHGRACCTRPGWSPSFSCWPWRAGSASRPVDRPGPWARLQQST
ncbi:putative rhomboid protease YdcA [Arthrobacter sp. Hiyo4]|nr:putative rhomboid protease YdcA [Arthrobacter sp. Hiyo4]